MIYIILSVRDTKAGSFAQPFYAPTLVHGIRSFLDAAAAEHPDNMMRKHPEDFELYHLGSFNDQDASFEPMRPQLVSKAIDVPAKPDLRS